MKTKIALQDAYELHAFVRNLDAHRITTPEFKSALMVLRQHCAKGAPLLEWANSIAHKLRDKGLTFEAGAGLWLEKYQIDAYFSTDKPRLKCIPAPIFERLLQMFDDPEFRFGGMDMKSHFPGGHSRAEISASIRWMYRKSEREGTYKLISRAHANVEDLELVQRFISQLASSDWGEYPYHFDDIRDSFMSTMNRLIGPSKRIVQKNANLLALHFLAAFHLTEVDLKLYHGAPGTRCFLSVDSTASGHLCLSLGLYKRDKGVWDAIELSTPNRPPRMAGSHWYTRPFLLTNLEEGDYFWNGTGSETSFEGAIRVARHRDGRFRLQPVTAFR